METKNAGDFASVFLFVQNGLKVLRPILVLFNFP